jgi:hypothetical protein
MVLWHGSNYVTVSWAWLSNLRLPLSKKANFKYHRDHTGICTSLYTGLEMVKTQTTFKVVFPATGGEWAEKDSFEPEVRE